MSPVLTNGQTIDKRSMKGRIMDFTWFTNTQLNGWTSSSLAMNTYFLKFRSSRIFMENSTLLEHTKKSTNQFLTFGMREEKFTSIKSIKCWSSEWTIKLNFKKKKKQPSELLTSWKTPNQSFKLSTLESKIPSTRPAPWLKSYSKFTNQIIWFVNSSMVSPTSSDLAGTDRSSTSTTEDYSVTFHPTTSPIVECLSIWTGINWRMVLRWWQAATTHCTSTSSTLSRLSSHKVIIDFRVVYEHKVPNMSRE